MDNSYLVPFGDGAAELVEKRSRFLGEVWRVETEEEARAHIEAVRRRCHDARHHCWCYVLREGNILRYSDDGEPQGTAGQPMLNVFLRQGVQNACCVVTRYFGGILLGAGGLTRAYGSAAKLALDAAGVCYMRLWAVVGVPCSYSLYERMRLLCQQSGGVVTETDFGAEVTLTVMLPAGSVEGFHEKVVELSAGQTEPIVLEEKFQPGPRE